MIFDKLEERGFKYNDILNFTWKNSNQTSVEDENLLKESTYFKCIDYTAKKMASLSIDIKQYIKDKGELDSPSHKFYEKIKLRPNNGMNVVDMIRCLTILGEHEGISCLYIDPYSNNLYPCKVNEIIIDDIGLIESKKENPVAIEIVCNNKNYFVPESSCIMYKGGITLDGINSNSIKDYLKNTFKTTIEGQKFLSELFSNGLTNKAVVQLASDIKDTNELKKVQAKFNNIYSSEGRIFTVPAGYSISTLNLSLADSQFEELRSLSRREIASCFGLTPSMIGEEDGSNLEEENLRYLTDTLLVKINALEQEFNYKYLSKTDRELGYRIKFNINALLRTTSEKQKNIIVDYVKNGIYPLEYARALLGVPLSNDGIVTLPSGQILLKDLLEGKATWQNKKKGGE